MSSSNKDISVVLLQRRIISSEQFDQAGTLQNTAGISFRQALLRLGYVTEKQIAVAQAEWLGLPFRELTNVTIPRHVLELVPESVARENVVIPLEEDGVSIVIAIANPEDGDTLEKLRFILNKKIQPVVAPEDQIRKAIEQHYGPSETESVDSMLMEFTDTAIDTSPSKSDQPPPPPAAPSPPPPPVLSTSPSRGAAASRPASAAPSDSDRATKSPAPSKKSSPPVPQMMRSSAMTPAPSAMPTPSPPLETRQATVRHYHRMTHGRMFPLLVVLSKRALEQVVKKNVSQEQSHAFQVQKDSFVEIEPVLPGCSCYPPKDQVRVEQDVVTTTFWVLPEALGKLSACRVVIRQKEQTLAEVPLEIKVVRQTLTLVIGCLSLLLPFLMMVLRHYGLDFESQLADGFGVYARLLNWVVSSLRPEVLMGAMLAMTLVAYLSLRPSKRDVFWDVELADDEDEEEQPQTGTAASQTAAQTADLAQETSPSNNGVTFDSRAALLRSADEQYELRNYRKALSLYDLALGLSPTRAVHYLRASMSAFEMGDVLQAFAILCHAEETLPTTEMHPGIWYNMGCFATKQGKMEEAIRYLNRAVDAGYANVEKLRTDPDLEPLRWHPNFKRLMESLEAST